jgi:hypothetical protein
VQHEIGIRKRKKKENKCFMGASAIKKDRERRIKNEKELPNTIHKYK